MDNTKELKKYVKTDIYRYKYLLILKTGEEIEVQEDKFYLLSFDEYIDKYIKKKFINLNDRVISIDKVEEFKLIKIETRVFMRKVIKFFNIYCYTELEINADNKNYNNLLKMKDGK